MSAMIYAQLTSGESVAAETALCEQHLAEHAAAYRAADGVGEHQACPDFSSLRCQVCGAVNTESGAGH